MSSPGASPDEAQLLAQFRAGRGSSRPQGHPASSEAQALAIYRNARPMGPVEDFGRSYVTGLEKAGTSILGLPAAIARTAGDAYRDIADVTHLDPSQSTPFQPPYRGPTTGAPAPRLPTPQVLDEKVQHVAGPYHVPQYDTGDLGEILGGNSIAALAPGGPGVRLARVVIPSLTAQGAGDLAPEKYKALARTAGGAAGGLGEGAFEAAAEAGPRLFGDAARNLTADQTAQVVALRQRARQMGIDLTVPEAVQQVTNGATGLGRVQRLVENANRTAPRMTEYFAPRPGQVRDATMGFADYVAPGGQSPGMLGLDAQQAAVRAQQAANRTRRAASSPAYRAADAQTVDQQAMADILANIDTSIAADKTGLIAPRLTQLRGNLTDASGAPILDIGNLATARNHWREVFDLPPTGEAPITKRQAEMIGGHLDDLDALLKANPNYAAGDAAYADASRNIVDPLNAGPVGDIAKTGDVGAQTAALHPANPPLGQPAETAAAYGALNDQQAGLAEALMRQHVGNTFNRSARDLVGGPNPYGGARFAKDIQGNAEQAATMNAGLDAIDPTGDMKGRWGDLVDALQATGWRQPPGAMTAFNLEDQNIAKQAPGIVRAIGAIGDPLEWTKNLSNWTGGRLYRRNLDMLADMLTDPDTAAILARARAANSPSLNPAAVVPLLTQGAGQ